MKRKSDYIYISPGPVTWTCLLSYLTYMALTVYLFIFPSESDTSLPDIIQSVAVMLASGSACIALFRSPDRELE